MGVAAACGGGGQVEPDTPPVVVPLTRVVATFPVAARPFGIDVSSKGIAYITQLDASTVTTADASAPKLTGVLGVGSTPTAVAFNGTGTVAYVANQASGTISVVNVATGTQAAVIPVSGNPLNVAVSLDGSAVYASTNDGRVSRIDPATRTVTASVLVGT
ncbi:MAG: YncE family protein, partial [Gemmatimonadaceae bacterium]